MKIEKRGQYYCIISGNRVIYKSKDQNKVQARYDQMTKVDENRERCLERFKENPYNLI